MSIHKRNYKNYKKYLEKQAEKGQKEDVKKQLMEQRKNRIDWFTNEFKNINLDKNSKILCLGARYGEEVQALRDLGYNAKGMDLNPNPPLVVAGDMNEYVKTAESNSWDAIYTNCLDHCWNVKEFLENILRIAKKVVFVHYGPGFRDYESQDIENVEDILNIINFESIEIDQFEGIKYRLVYKK